MNDIAIAIAIDKTSTLGGCLLVSKYLKLYAVLW